MRDHRIDQDPTPQALPKEILDSYVYGRRMGRTADAERRKPVQTRIPRPAAGGKAAKILRRQR